MVVGGTQKIYDCVHSRREDLKGTRHSGGESELPFVRIVKVKSIPGKEGADGRDPSKEGGCGDKRGR